MNGALPLVSVVIPCYNHQNYVKKSVTSALNQTYKNIEVIVIDDGSKDDSVKILKEIQKNNQFILECQENAGVCKTLNKAIKMSNGKYIAVLASDDYWDLTKIEKQVKILESNANSEFCFTQALEFDSETEKKINIFPKKPMAGNVLNSVFVRQHVPAGSIMFSKKLFDKLDGFDENLKEEDWDFVIRSAAITEFTNVKEPLFFYRSHEANIMKTRERSEIFRQKALLLSKNFNLVSPFLWFFSISMHFFYDIMYKGGK
ncbi:glycosyltransferase family 2 protein [Campylobacter geochelonis]|uniref:glycosyltransferase family 2 protein n=1 Tax=Campylobacter geochelonis TaxID=1780362 RepID=UPI000770B322|nr:glycosyltransferase family A protein [Campylobacter geochelonis]CZE49292.1 putative glycosyltransferase [Campylobacter geochelonis]CZE51410.1 putative glycosyltransferase [Campylobacter geochelonis]